MGTDDPLNDLIISLKPFALRIENLKQLFCFQSLHGGPSRDRVVVRYHPFDPFLDGGASSGISI